MARPTDGEAVAILKQNSHARSSLVTLTLSGCNEVVAAGLVFSLTEDLGYVFKPVVPPGLRTDARRNLKSLAVTLHKAANLRKQLDRMAVHLFGATAIDDYIRDADIAIDIEQRIASNSEEPEPLFSDIYLYRLATYVSETSGSPHYRELADLIAAAFEFRAGEVPDWVNEQAIRKRVTRFAQAHPYYAALEHTRWKVA
jgi:hypothetical protein